MCLLQGSKDEVVTVASDVEEEEWEALLAVVKWLHGIAHAGHFHPLFTLKIWR